MSERSKNFPISFFAVVMGHSRIGDRMGKGGKNTRMGELCQHDVARPVRSHLSDDFRYLFFENHQISGGR